MHKMQVELNGNKWDQFVHYIKNPFSTDFRSAQFSRPVQDVIGDRVWATLLLLHEVRADIRPAARRCGLHPADQR
jgi:ABC-type dipeptide/oligopeptide/nickel transport system permease component